MLQFLTMIKNFLLRWLVNFLGLWGAATLVAGIQYSDRIKILIIAALIFSIVNMLIRPFIILLALPAIVVTLGLFTLVINAAMLYLVTLFYPKFEINSFSAAIFAVIIIWLVNLLITNLLDSRQNA